MAIIHMVAAKKMRNTIFKYSLLISISAFAFLSFYSFANAINYNEGLYNAGLYSTVQPLTPVASPIAGTYNATQSVSLTASQSTSIRYSTSSTPADCSSGTLYTTGVPISVSTSQTIYVRACDSYNNSSTGSFAYVIDTTAPASPVASPVAGTYTSTQSVSLTASGSDYIKYSVSSIPATCSSGTSYGSAISVSASQTIYARACDNAGNSSTGSFAYVINTTAPSTPVVSPVAGTYTSTQSVSLSSAGSTSIRYSTSSTPADCSSGTLYTVPISVSASQTIYARACDNATNSSTASFAYIISSGGGGGGGGGGGSVSLSTPVASPIAGTYNTTQSISLTASQSTSIRYSTSSMPATCSNGTLYTTGVPISVSTSQTIYVRACGSSNNSSTSSFTYTILSSDGLIIAPTTQPATTVVLCQGLSINRKIKLTSPRMKGDDIKSLQACLNLKLHSENPLVMDGIYGTKTRQDVISFQKLNNLVQDAVVGALTKAKLQDGLNIIPTVTTTTQPATTVALCQSLSINRKIKLTSPRMKGEDIKSLQACLNLKLHSENPLVMDGVYGTKTRQDVISFQKLNNLTQDATVGPLTKAELLK